MNNYHDIIVTTGDLKRDYRVLGPVYFQVSNKGLFGSALGTLKKQYSNEIQAMKQKGTMSGDRADWGFLYGEWSVGQNDFEAAFFIATEELKKRAAMVGGDAVICMRQDIDMDTNGFAYFYLQMYGTAVKFTYSNPEESKIIERDQERKNKIESLSHTPHIFFCKDCWSAFGGIYETRPQKCSKCGGAIVETTILRDTWRSLSVDQKVQALFDDGVITKEEYEAKRKSYINS